MNPDRDRACPHAAATERVAYRTVASIRILSSHQFASQKLPKLVFRH